jgi:transcriptional regulator GlxA family with amidase domain
MTNRLWRPVLRTDLAMPVARWLVMFVRRSGGQSQFSAQPTLQAADRALQAWIVEHPTTNWTCRRWRVTWR